MAWNIVGKQAEARSTSGVISLLRNTRPRPVCTLVAVMKSLIDASPRCAKSILWRRISLMGLKPNGLRLYGETTRDIKSIATYAGDVSSVQRLISRSSGDRWIGLNRAA